MKLDMIPIDKDLGFVNDVLDPSLFSISVTSENSHGTKALSMDILIRTLHIISNY